MTDESIVALERAAVFAGEWPQGFVPASECAIEPLLAAIRTRGFAVERALAERSPQWKQPIPYCLIVRGSEVFCVERLPRQGEGRLHGRLSLGIGGHIDGAELADNRGPVHAALLRELHEEVALPADVPARPAFLGLLNDDRDEVGRVHFGLVFAQALRPGDEVQIVESTKMRGGFRRLVGPDGLWQDLARFETWSRILLEAGAVESLASRHA